MHTRLILSLFLAMGVTSVAQIPNASFENWSAPNGWDDPDGWMTNNGFTSQYGIYTCEPDQPGLDSDFFIALTSHMLPGLSVMPGTAITGDVLTGVEGFPYDQRPAALTGWWQHQSTGLDEGMVAVTFTKWNPGTQQRDDIGAGYLFADSSFSGWYLFSVPIFYVSPEYPDTATITLASSANGLLTDGSSLFVDALAFAYTTSIGGTTDANDARVRLFPIPCAESLTAEGLPAGNWRITDMTGRTVLTGRSTGALRQEVSVSDLLPGSYLLISDNSRLRFTKG